ncbi:MAG: AMP-dependent synthetase and ligase [Bradyrhizobium sp.]|nr:AMP-dependent synthetase and ligase [Bradyrhizobium sp.]
MTYNIDFFLDDFRTRGTLPALAWRDQTLDFATLTGMIESRIGWAENEGIGLGTPVVLVGDFSFDSVAILLALIARKAIVIPLTEASYQSLGPMLDDVAPQFLINACGTDVTIERRAVAEPNELYRTLIDRGSSGLVLFTSGSTGKPKAVVHDYEKLLQKFKTPRPGMVTLNFLLFDHWGGLNTLFGCFASGHLTVLPESRKPDEILELVEKHKIALLPTTPTFLNMVLVSRALERHDASSLRLISYGAEPMPASTLARIREALPGVELRQTYGMIELGVMRAKSKSSDSLWVKLGGEGFELRVIDGLLQVRADSAMLGYLNAPSPFTEDRFFMTGDRVEQDGEYFRILGRDSDLINVGGQKVYPAEVETLILELPEVIDAAVYGERNILTGNIVCADVTIAPGVDPAELRSKIKRHCSAKLQAFMVPVRINFPTESLHTSRLKRRRSRP